MTPMIHVFPCVPHDAKFPGWDGVSPAAGLLTTEMFPPAELTTELDDGDYRFITYSIPGEESIPRINLAAIPVLEGMGVEPVAHFAVVDVDLPGHRQWASLSEASAFIEGVLSRAEETETDLLYNAAFYTTRAGYRLMWQLTDPLPVSKYRALLRYVMAELTKKYDIECDSSSDEWNRMFRMPCCLRDDVLMQSYSDLEPLADATLDPYSFGELADNSDFVTEIAGEHPVPLDDLDLDVWKAAFKHPYLKRGRPFPADEAGSTYRTMRRAIASLAHEGPVYDPEHLFAMVYKSVEATAERRLQEAWKMCVWTCSKQKGMSARPPEVADRPLNPDPIDDETWSEWFRAVDKRRAPTLNLFRAGRAFTPKSQAEDKLLTAIFSLASKLRITDPIELYRMVYASAQESMVDPMKVWEQCEQSAAHAQSERDGSATDDEKKAAIFCSEQPITIAIPGTQVLYQLDLRNPTHPTYQLTDKSCLLMHFNHLTAGNLPFEADFADGKTRPLDQLLLDYGNSATKIRYVTGQRGASFVPNLDGNGLDIGVHALHPDLRPVFHEEVQQWLDLFGGSDPKRFLDWLSVITMTTYPVCAMYVHGEPGSGKSMLLQALGAMWGAAPVPFANVTSNFNESMLVSPVISADEELGAGTGDVSGVFRNIIANSSHDIRIKFQANATLHACLRMLIMANETDVLDFKKSLSGRSLEAIVKRVLFIEQGKDPVKYLEALGGRQGGTSDWAERSPGVPGRIGEHILWLRENRPVKSAGRFLVEGVMTPWHRQFIGQQGIKPDIIKVVALAAKQASRMLYSGTPVPGIEIRKDKQCVLITKEAVGTQWSQHGRGEPPRERTLDKTLDQLNEGPQCGIKRPRMGKKNQNAGQAAVAVSFRTLIASEYVTEDLLMGKMPDFSADD